MLVDKKKCNLRLSFTEKVDEKSLNCLEDNTNHSTRESLRSATVAVIIRTLHQICEDCIIPTGHVLWALAASDGLPVKDTDQLVCVLKLDHFQKPELGFTVLDEKV